jgi:parvulin-like peptidyl-prolyl isomerase
MLRDPDRYQADLDAAVAQLLEQPNHQLLREHGILEQLVRTLLNRQLEAEQPDLEARYGPRVEALFLERRAALEQVVFGLIRLEHLQTAEELYLRLSDDGADFGTLARQFSLGQERLSGGLVGPMPISQLHPRLAAALGPLENGELHPPVRLDPFVLLLRLEHREPASLDAQRRQQLLQELLQLEAQQTVEAQLARLNQHLDAGSCDG